MEDYPSNSHKKKARQEPEVAPKKVERVIEGEVVRRKKPLGKRFASFFISGDAKTVGDYLLLDVLLPAVKDTLADLMSQGVEKMLFGEARSTSRRTGTRPNSGSHISYNRMSQQSNPYGRPEPRNQPSRRARASHDFDEIILPTRVEAEEVIDRLFDLVAKYETATVADLYELVGVTSAYTDDKWGWTDLRGAAAVRVRNGYLLDLPRPEPLD